MTDFKYEKKNPVHLHFTKKQQILILLVLCDHRYYTLFLVVYLWIYLNNIFSLISLSTDQYNKTTRTFQSRHVFSGGFHQYLLVITTHVEYTSVFLEISDKN